MSRDVENIVNVKIIRKGILVYQYLKTVESVINGEAPMDEWHCWVTTFGIYIYQNFDFSTCGGNPSQICEKFSFLGKANSGKESHRKETAIHQSQICAKSGLSRRRLQRLSIWICQGSEAWKEGKDKTVKLDAPSSLQEIFVTLAFEHQLQMISLQVYESAWH